MTHDDSPYTHGDGLASAVRDLAAQARRVLNSPPGVDEAPDLSRRIASLQDQLRRRPAAGHLPRWLENLRRQVDEHQRDGASPSPPAGSFRPTEAMLCGPCSGR